MQANLRRRTRAASESAISDITSAAATALSVDGAADRGSPRGTSRGRQASMPAIVASASPLTLNRRPLNDSESLSPERLRIAFVGAPAAAAAAAAARGEISPVERRRRRRGSSTPPVRSASLFFSQSAQSDASAGDGGGYVRDGKGRGGKGNASTLPRESRDASSELPSEDWSDLGADSIDGLVGGLSRNTSPRRDEMVGGLFRNSSPRRVSATETSTEASPMSGDDSSLSQLAAAPTEHLWYSPLLARWARGRLGPLGNIHLAVSPLKPRQQTRSSSSSVAVSYRVGSSDDDGIGVEDHYPEGQESRDGRRENAIGNSIGYFPAQEQQPGISRIGGGARASLSAGVTDSRVVSKRSADSKRSSELGRRR